MPARQTVTDIGSLPLKSRAMAIVSNSLSQSGPFAGFIVVSTIS